MAKSQSALKKCLLASVVLLAGAAVGSGVALAQERTTSFGDGGFGGGSPNPNPNPNPTSHAVDPGVRGGAAGAGGPIAGLTTNQLNFFNAAEVRFENIDAVPAPGGLGPAFNDNSCAACHSQPAVGGTSPAANNPEVAVANLDGATNVVPSFVTANGPVREARFVNNPGGTPDGSVHDLFTIAGRSDAPGCTMAQPNFAAELAANNVSFRIPTPLFGLGLVEATSDEILRADFSATSQQRSSLGISGNFNLSGNTNNITRFGWKAQNPSLLVFAEEAYDVEMGVTNEGFPEERLSPPADCIFNGTPEDTTNLTDNGASNSPASDFSSDVINFAAFMRFTAPPAPATPTTSSTPTASTSSTSTTQVVSADAASVLSAASGTPSTSSAGATSSAGSTVAADASQGQQVFQNIGCSACHTPTMTSGLSGEGPAGNGTGNALTHVTFHPFSDFAVHDMGTGLADRVTQGAANGQQFRSAPLWGVGQRVFFLHDGRTDNLVTAIEDHASNGSEANTVINNFNMLSTANQQALIDFLRSL
jgi:CxxC motif-containing protein (DUF1111 family)